MTTIRTTIRNGRVDVPAPEEVPDGTEVILTIGLSASDENEPMSPEEIARVLAAMQKLEPLEIPEDVAARPVSGGCGRFSLPIVLGMQFSHSLCANWRPTNRRQIRRAKNSHSLCANCPRPFCHTLWQKFRWGHKVTLMEKVKDSAQRLWYAAKTLEHGWSRAVLTVQIESNQFGRQGKAISNFSNTLPKPQSDLAQQSLKDKALCPLCVRAQGNPFCRPCAEGCV